PGPLDRDLPVVAETQRPRLPGGLGEAARIARLVRPLTVARQPFEHARECTFPHPSRALRRQLEPAAVPLDEPGVLEHLLDLLQASQVAHGRPPERPAGRTPVA